mgnify:FL=1
MKPVEWHAANVKRLRRYYCHMNQEDFAELARVGVDTVAKWETGRYRPTRYVILRRLDELAREKGFEEASGPVALPAADGLRRTGT